MSPLALLQRLLTTFSYAAGLMDGEYADLVKRGKTKVEIFELR